MSVDLYKDFHNRDLCPVLYQYIQDVSGIEKESASPSDIWFVNFKSGVFFDEKPLDKAVMKVFFSPYQDLYNDHIIENIDGLIYEVKIYKLINSLVLNKQCPFFTTMITSSLDCRYENIFNILNTHFKNTSKTDNQLQRNFSHLWRMPYRRVISITDEQAAPIVNPNLLYSYYNKKGKIRRAYGAEFMKNTNTGIVPLSLDTLKNKKYSYLMMREFAHNHTTLKEFLNDYTYKALDPLFYYVIFQIAVACYALKLKKIVHNDLHLGNVIVEYLDKKFKMPYTIYNKKGKSVTYYYETNMRVVLFDFDRSYSPHIGENKKLDAGGYCTEKAGYQCNKIVKGRDLFQIYCYTTRIIGIDPVFIGTITDNIPNFTEFSSTYDFCTSKKTPKIFKLPEIINNLAQHAGLNIIHDKTQAAQLIKDNPETSYILNPKDF